MLDGDVGVGKTRVVAWLAASLTTGRGVCGAAGPRAVVFATPRDLWSGVLRPRLEAHGAKLGNVGVTSTVIEPNDIRSFELERHIDYLPLRTRGSGVGLLVINPLEATLGKLRTGDMARVGQLFSRLRGIADNAGFSILLVRHTGKRSGGRRAVHQGTGSLGMMAGVQVGWLLLHDPDNPTQRFLATSLNRLATDGETVRLDLAGGVVRVCGTLPVTADELISGRAAGTHAARLDAPAAARRVRRIVKQPTKCAEVKQTLTLIGFGPYAIRKGLKLSGLKRVKLDGTWFYLPMDDVAQGDTSGAHIVGEFQATVETGLST
jgi:hypothetical protein